MQSKASDLPNSKTVAEADSLALNGANLLQDKIVWVSKTLHKQQLLKFPK